MNYFIKYRFHNLRGTLEITQRERILNLWNLIEKNKDTVEKVWRIVLGKNMPEVIRPMNN